jgi:hypothetical protein
VPIFPDERSAREYAEVVARELMAHREPRTRAWRLDVRDSNGLPCFDLLFATIDDTLGHLRPQLRSSIEAQCASAASFAEAIRAIRLTLLEVQAILARAEGAPCSGQRRGGPLTVSKTAGRTESCPTDLSLVSFRLAQMQIVRGAKIFALEEA